MDENEPLVDLVTAVEAGRRLNRSAATIRYWVIRYNAVQVGRQGRAKYYDFADLAAIERYIEAGLPVPDDPDVRNPQRVRPPSAA
jgi:hypothetical protein